MKDKASNKARELMVVMSSSPSMQGLYILAYHHSRFRCYKAFKTGEKSANFCYIF